MGGGEENNGGDIMFVRHILTLQCGDERQERSRCHPWLSLISGGKERGGGSDGLIK